MESKDNSSLLKLTDISCNLSISVKNEVTQCLPHEENIFGYFKFQFEKVNESVELQKITHISREEYTIIKKRANFNCYMNKVKIPFDEEDIKENIKRDILKLVKTNTCLSPKSDDKNYYGGMEESELIEFWIENVEKYGYDINPHFYQMMKSLVISGDLCRIKGNNCNLYF